MQKYKTRFEEDFLVECPYKMCQEDACEQFWRGIPPEICHLRRDASESRDSQMRGLKDAKDATNHIEAPAPHQLEAVEDDDVRIDPENKTPSEVFTKGDNGETGSS
ncbi:hypothetical protein TIFTF001_031991 [Ficus carica]|uniref:Uncharacterized protein n=1 Tax=Ficus carica TaxID=3494 RepID=A0AA88J530_FICCA|nr:hypothetical protein TIFTF001_031991 [Ficus carica]